MDTLPNNSFPLKKIPSNACKQAQYWEKVFELAGIPNDNNGDDHYAKSVSVFGVILVRIFLHLELIRRDSKYPSISPYSVQMWKNADQENSEYRHFSCSGTYSRT